MHGKAGKTSLFPVPFEVRLLEAVDHQAQLGKGVSDAVGLVGGQVLELEVAVVLLEQPPDLLSPHILDALDQGPGVVDLLDIVRGLADENVADLKEFIIL